MFSRYDDIFSDISMFYDVMILTLFLEPPFWNDCIDLDPLDFNIFWLDYSGVVWWIDYGLCTVELGSIANIIENGKLYTSLLFFMIDVHYPCLFYLKRTLYHKFVPDYHY